MGSVTCSMSVSLDGYIVGPDGSFDWTVPDEVRKAGVPLLGRRLYETMPYCEVADQNRSLDFSTLECAAIRKALPMDRSTGVRPARGWPRGCPRGRPRRARC